MPTLRKGHSAPATKADIERLEAMLRENTRELLGYMGERINKSDHEHAIRFNKSDHEHAIINTKLDAIMSGEVLVTRTQLHRLLRILKSKGIEIDESEVITA